MLKKVLALIMLIFSFIIILKIYRVWAKNEGNKDTEFIEKVNQEIIYIQKKLEDNLNELENENWITIQGNIDNIYLYWNTVILDLNELEIKNTYLSGFGKKLDELTLAIRDKNIDVSKIRICELYNYLYLYVENYNKDEEFKNKFNAKKNLILAYTVVENKNWDLINEYIVKAEESIKIALNLNTIQNKYNLSKLYIAIKELQNSLELKDIDIFYKKYNLIMNQMLIGV